MVLAPSKSYLTSKAGPLPVWGWMGIGLGGALGYALYKQRKSQAQNAGAQASTPGYTLPSNIQPQTTYLSQDTYSQVRNFGGEPRTHREHPPAGGSTDSPSTYVMETLPGLDEGLKAVKKGGGAWSKWLSSPTSPLSSGYNSNRLPESGEWVTASADGQMSTLQGIVSAVYGSQYDSMGSVPLSYLFAAPQNRDIVHLIGSSGTNQFDKLPTGTRVWVPGTPTGNPTPYSGGSTSHGGPRPPGGNDNWQTGPGSMPGGNGDRSRGGQRNGGGGYQPGGQRSNTHGGR